MKGACGAGIFGLRRIWKGVLFERGVNAVGDEMFDLFCAVYGVFLAVDFRLMGYVVVASLLVATATVLGLRKLMRIEQMVLPAISVFLFNLLVLWLIFDVFLGYPLFQIQSIFEIP